jgi:hypothetical protein
MSNHDDDPTSNLTLPAADATFQGELIDVLEGSLVSNTMELDNRPAGGKEALIKWCTSEQSNRSWELCNAGRWAELHMRLGLFPEEVCTVMRENHRSILHEVCSSSTRMFVSPLNVMGIYFACPQALLLQDLSHKRTPLHCALMCVEPDEAPSLDMICTILDLTQEQDEGTGCEDDDTEQVAALLEDSLGQTPLHAACRAGASAAILRALLNACPSALVKYDKEGMTPLKRLWARLEAIVGQSKIDSIQSWRDILTISEVRDAWEKIVMFLQVLTTWQIPDDEEEEEEEGFFTENGSPELCFQLLHAIASTDCPGELMSLALKLYPEDFLQLDDDGQNVLDVAIAQSVTADSSIVYALLKHDKDGALYKMCEANCCHSQPPLHRAILAGKGWSGGIQSLCDGDANVPTEADTGTGLYPFMMAATVAHDATGALLSEELIIGTIFELLRRAPELAASALPG